MKRTLDIILAAGVVLSLWLAHYIPADVFNKLISPALFAVTVTFFGASLIYRHAEGLRVRKVWGFSSRNVFSNVFTRETGLSPRDWFKKCNPA